MKSISIDVEFVSPEKKIEEDLRKNGARDISVRRTYGNKVEVRYVLEIENIEEQIENLIMRAGGNQVRASSNYHGARFDFKLEDLIDEREFKRQIIDKLRKSGFRAN